jgi:peroxiredoxin
MIALLLSLILILCAAVLLLAFFVVGALQALGRLNWRLDQLELTRPSRVGREGLMPGAKAPDFTLHLVSGGEISLGDFAGHKLLLVFMQPRCGPCETMTPALNLLHDEGDYQLLVVSNGELEETRAWSAQIRARFPVAVQENFSLSKRYEAFATPFAFVIDEAGVIAAKGIVGSTQYLNFVLSDADQRFAKHDTDPKRDSTVERASRASEFSKELSHV